MKTHFILLFLNITDQIFESVTLNPGAFTPLLNCKKTCFSIPVSTLRTYYTLVYRVTASVRGLLESLYRTKSSYSSVYHLGQSGMVNTIRISTLTYNGPITLTSNFFSKIRDTDPYFLTKVSNLNIFSMLIRGPRTNNHDLLREIMYFSLKDFI